MLLLHIYYIVNVTYTVVDTQDNSISCDGECAGTMLAYKVELHGPTYTNNSCEGRLRLCPCEKEDKPNWYEFCDIEPSFAATVCNELGYTSKCMYNNNN